jgi:hypothetical protein
MIFHRTSPSPLIGRFVKNRDCVQNPFSEYLCSKFVGLRDGECIAKEYPSTLSCFII